MTLILATGQLIASVGRWGDGEMGRWGDFDHCSRFPVPRSAVPYSLLPTPYSLLPTPFAL
ncbi:hypothetical protein [Moorena producens]|uniref:hypothetical protein n=1 Tax=Moorena producens TaxID=1155739 RepID=UPI000A91CA02|nr:hypothetical protein [Moorena producens]